MGDDGLDFGGNEGGFDEPMGDDSSDDKPFDDEPFDAGVEADEETDPKKFIEQLTGKLGQSLRKYTDEQGEPDFALEKFAINSLLSATHTSEMDSEDQKDIIEKVRTAGEGNEEPSSEEGFEEPQGEEGLEEYSIYENMDNLFVNPKKNNMFQPNSNDKLKESDGLWVNIHAKRKRGEAPAKPSDDEYPDKKQWDKLTKEELTSNETNNYMFWQNLKTMNDSVNEILGMDKSEVDRLVSDGHGWAIEHVVKAKDDVEEVYHFLNFEVDKDRIMNEDRSMNNYVFFGGLKTILHATSNMMEMDYNTVDSILSDGHGWALDHIATAANDIESVYHFLANELNAYDGDTEGGYEDEFGNVEVFNLAEAEYKGRKVKLGKPTKGDVKKYKVFVKNKKGNVIKVNFGDPNMKIKRDDPERRKSFRARHKCAQAKDRTTPRYWSCKMWSKKPVSDIVGENLIKQEKNSIFDKLYLKNKLHETFNQDDTMNQPITEPSPVITPTKPSEKPAVQPSRKNKPFLPMPEVTPDPKAENNG